MKFKPPTFLFILCFFLSCFTHNVQAQDTLPLKFSERFIKKLTKKRDYLVFPQIGRSPETGFLSGIYYLQLFKIGHDSTARTSNTETTISFTQHRQFLAELNNTILFHKEKFILRGTNSFSKYSEFFWGVGSDSRREDRELVEFNTYQLVQRLTYSFGHHVFAGLQYQYYQVSDVRSKKGGLLDSLNFTGAHGSKTSGLGLLFLYDTRDNVINPTRGTYFDASNFVNAKLLGSNYEFNNFTVDTRRYLPLGRHQVLAFQGLLNFNSGEIPFRQLAAMGGDIMMRGIYKGRYRDNNLLALQAEYRFQVWRFIGMTLFASGAEVTHEISNFNYSNVKYSYGFAFRLMLIEHERINVGMDFGFSKNTTAVYIGLGEAF